MPITLSPTTEKLIRDKIDSGEFATPDDVVRAALDALGRLDDFRPGELAALVADGEASLEQEGGIPLADVVAELSRDSDERRRRAKDSA